MKTEHTPDNFWQDEARRYAQNADYWHAERDRLKAANAEMLEALKASLAVFHLDSDMEEDFADEIKQINAAIAKAEAL